MMTDTRDERSARLEARLQDGYTKIGKALSQGVPVAHWEDAWVTLLNEYEKIEDEKAAHHAEVRQVEREQVPRTEVLV